MSFLAMKQNPFEDFGAGWEGASGRVMEAAATAADAASEVLIETLQERGSKLDQFSDEMLSEVRPGMDPTGIWHVGLPDDSPHAAAAREAEYGSTETPPTGLMRSSERQVRAEAEEVFTEVLHEELFG